MTVSKTKAKLVDVARQLFAKMGVENTTMNDIALASKKGRRTLYTYFKSKDEIYLAVVESELDILSDMMKRVAEKNISPDEKLLEMLLDPVKKCRHWENLFYICMELHVKIIKIKMLREVLPIGDTFVL